MRKFSLTVILTITMGVISFAQQIVTGNVSDEQGNPISEVIVSVKGTEIKTTTNNIGVYSVVIPVHKKKLSFQKSEFQVKEVEVNRNVVNIIMSKLKIDIFELSLKQLMEISVVSASNVKEKLSEVPATMIVITAEDILQRGYLQVDEIFDDLPGMQMARSHGTISYYRNYMRGFRNSSAEPYLVMVDGLLVNDLYFGSGMHLPAVPVSSIERIEVVYGPVSSVYGANAFMGVINVITKKDMEENGTSINMQTSNNFGESVHADFHVLVKKDELRLSIAGKIQSYSLSDIIDNNSYEYLKDKYQTDERLWGGTLNSPNYGSGTNTPRNEKGIDSRLFYGNTEVGMQVRQMRAGWGYEYPTDKALTSTVTRSNDFTVYFKHNQQFSEQFSGRFRMSYRTNFGDNADWIEGYNTTNTGSADMELGGGYILTPGETARIIDHSTWSDYASSYIAQQDFDIKLNDKLSFNAGLKFEQKSASDQISVYGTAYFADSLHSPSDEGFIAGAASVQDYKGFLHIQKEYGTYLQSKYRIAKNHILNIGARIDHNSIYGTNNTIRAGYIGKFGNFTGKLLYGEAYQPPTPRSLYSTWSAQGTSTDLIPEESQTIEASLAYTKKSISSMVSAYHVINTNTIVQFAGGAANMGERKITGIDIHLRGQIKPSFMKEIQTWAYFSLILNEEEKKFDENDNDIGTGIIGDLSYNNAYFGLTGIFNEHLSLNLIGRYVGERITVETNPIDKIDSYFTMNPSIVYKELFVKGLSLRFKVNNIFDAQYFHPGIKNADAGETPGQWVGDAWQGSTGWYNSKLPQAHRYYMISLIFNL